MERFLQLLLRLGKSEHDGYLIQILKDQKLRWLLPARFFYAAKVSPRFFRNTLGFGEKPRLSTHAVRRKSLVVGRVDDKFDLEFCPRQFGFATCARRGVTLGNPRIPNLV